MPVADTDAVRARYREALARRLQAAPPAVQRWLHEKLRTPGEGEGEAELAWARETPPPATPTTAPRRKAASVPRKNASPLALLSQQDDEGTVRSELRSAQAFRETWSRICAENDVNQAAQRAPENAGPLNSHMLVLRTLSLMRELSPDYLRRFMAHADTLLWLEQAGTRLKAPVPALAGKAKPARSKR